MNAQIYEEATHWLIKHRETQLGPQEKREFDAWLRQSPQHVRAYLEMSALWEDLPALDPNWNLTADELIARARAEENIYPLQDASRNSVTVLYPEHARNTSEASLKVSNEAGLKREAAASVHVKRERLKFFALAASMLIAVGGVITWYWQNLNTYATDIGEQRSIVLADGSTVELNSRSRVRIRYSEARRDVDLLYGQALFRVAHNTHRPFVVHSGTADVRAVGTQFDVYKKRGGTVVTVVEGKVAVLGGDTDSSSPAALKSSAPSNSAGSGAVFLVAGQQLTVPVVKTSRAGKSAAMDSPQRANVVAATAWTHRTLVFESSRLTEVAEEFNRYNTRQLVIDDAELANIHISGMFSSVDPALLLKFLHTQSELNVAETETEIRISKK